LINYRSVKMNEEKNKRKSVILIEWYFLIF